MTGDFNIRDISWDPNYSHYSHHSQVFFDIADFFHLELSKPIEQISTRYSNNQQDSNLVIDLIFLRLESLEYDNYTICPNLRLTSDYTCYELKSLESDNRTTLVLSNTRELNRDSFIK